MLIVCKERCNKRNRLISLVVHMCVGKVEAVPDEEVQGGRGKNCWYLMKIYA